MTRPNGANTLQVPEHRGLVSHRVVDESSHLEELEELPYREVRVPSREVEGAKRRPEVGILIRGNRVI